MSSYYYIQVRQTGNGKVVIAWPMDAEETYCVYSGVVITAGTGHCRPHAEAAEACPTATRTPPECKHPAADLSEPQAPVCRTCGLVGTDGTEYLKNVPPPSDVPMVPEAT